MMLEVLRLIDRGHATAAELALDRVMVGEDGAEQGELVRHDGTIWKERRVGQVQIPPSRLVEESALQRVPLWASFCALPRSEERRVGKECRSGGAECGDN